MYLCFDNLLLTPSDWLIAWHFLKMSCFSPSFSHCFRGYSEYYEIYLAFCATGTSLTFISSRASIALSGFASFINPIPLIESLNFSSITFVDTRVFTSFIDFIWSSFASFDNAEGSIITLLSS